MRGLEVGAKPDPATGSREPRSFWQLPCLNAYDGLPEESLESSFTPFQQVYRADLDIAFNVRTAGGDPQALAALRREARSMDPNVGVSDASP